MAYDGKCTVFELSKSVDVCLSFDDETELEIIAGYITAYL